MLNFLRSKSVGVEKMPDGSFLCWGFLSDDIYGVRMRVFVDPESKLITSVSGEFDRYTTPECPKSIPLLQTAIGMDISDPDFNHQVNKEIGRAACENFAALLIECGFACRAAMLADAWQEAKKQNPDISLAEFIGDPQTPQQQKPMQAAAPKPETASNAAAPVEAAPLPSLEYNGGGFVVDLHTHSLPASPCATASIDDMLAEARRIGLNAVCLTDHNHYWPPEKIAELSERHGILVLRGSEITTVQGDILVFGCEPPINGIPTAAELCQAVREAGGITIAAHPFRGFRTVNADDLGLTLDKAKQRPLFKLVDGIEAANSKVTADENKLAAQVAQALGKPAVGGSDAHYTDEVGLFATSFESPIHNEQELIQAIAGGQGRPVAFRE